MEILKKPICDLGLSNRCQSILRNLNIHSLADVVTSGWQQLREDPKFDQRCFHELVRLMEAESILHLLDEPPAQ